MALLIDRKVVFNMRIRTPSAPQADEFSMLKTVRSSSPREMGLAGPETACADAREPCVLPDGRVLVLDFDCNAKAYGHEE